MIPQHGWHAHSTQEQKPGFLQPSPSLDKRTKRTCKQMFQKFFFKTQICTCKIILQIMHNKSNLKFDRKQKTCNMTVTLAAEINDYRVMVTEPKQTCLHNWRIQYNDMLCNAV